MFHLSLRHRDTPVLRLPRWTEFRKGRRGPGRRFNRFSRELINGSNNQLSLHTKPLMQAARQLWLRCSKHWAAVLRGVEGTHGLGSKFRFSEKIALLPLRRSCPQLTRGQGLTTGLAREPKTDSAAPSQGNSGELRRGVGDRVASVNEPEPQNFGEPRKPGVALPKE